MFRITENYCRLQVILLTLVPIARIVVSVTGVKVDIYEQFTNLQAPVAPRTPTRATLVTGELYSNFQDHDPDLPYSYQSLRRSDFSS